MDPGQSHMMSALQPKDSPVVWIIESREAVVEQVEKVLNQAGWTSKRFDDPRELVWVDHRSMPDVVVLGLAASRIDAVEFLVREKEFADGKNVPVVALFSEDDVVDVVDVMHAGAVDAIAIDRLDEELTRRLTWALGKVPRSVPSEREPHLSFLTQVIEASPNAIVAARRSGEILLFNPAAERIIGWKQTEACGLNVRQLYPPGGAERIMALIRSDEYGDFGQVDSLREVLVNTEGELIPVEISAALVHQQGEEIATVGIFTDLRHQVEMEERLQEAIHVLEQAQRQAVVAEVAGAAAHNLNQPLTSLIGYAEFLQRQIDEDHEFYRPLNIIFQDARMIAEIVRRIGRITQYRTREYPGGEQIVDLDASSLDGASEIGSTLEWNRGAEYRSTDGE